MAAEDLTKRLGPSVKVEFSCLGCRFLEAEDGQVGRRYKCTEPSLVEKMGVPQYTGSTYADTPTWCPYRRERC